MAIVVTLSMPGPETRRLGLYVSSWLLSAVALGITAWRTSQSEPTATGLIDYRPSPILPEILLTTIISILWATLAIFILRRKVNFGLLSSYVMEIFVLMILLALYFTGACFVSAHSLAPRACGSVYPACEFITALVVLMWVNFATIAALLVFAAAFAFSDRKQFAAFWTSAPQLFGAEYPAGVEVLSDEERPPVASDQNVSVVLRDDDDASTMKGPIYL